jgi:glycosyltransferase involved in cell wall biosynthesis
VAAGGGGADWLGNLKAEAAGLGSRLEWSDAEFDAQRLAHCYGQLDIFCYPSLAAQGETFGVAVAEAMAARCAVVVSDLACFRDLVTSEETGLSFDHTGPAAPERLAAQLGRLVVDGALRDRLARRGQEHARRFDYAEVSRTILADLAVLTGTAAGNPLR